MKRICYAFFLLVFFVSAASAKTWTINFGGALGNVYSPSSLDNVTVGDTITWVGSFSFHPLTLTQSPSGAATFAHHNTGNRFSYVVTAPGSYSYQCDVHFSFGMTGTFTAAASGVDQPVEMQMMMDPSYPNPAMHESMVHFELTNPGHVILRVFDATGKLVLTPADDDMEPGFHMVTIDTKQLAAGSYQYVLQQGNAVLRREMIVVK